MLRTKKGRRGDRWIGNCLRRRMEALGVYHVARCVEGGKQERKNTDVNN